MLDTTFDMDAGGTELEPCQAGIRLLRRPRGQN